MAPWGTRFERQRTKLVHSGFGDALPFRSGITIGQKQKKTFARCKDKDMANESPTAAARAAEVRLRQEYLLALASAKAAARDAEEELAWLFNASWRRNASAAEVLGAHMVATGLLEKALKEMVRVEAVAFDILLDSQQAAERPARNRAQLQAAPQPRLELVEREAA